MTPARPAARSSGHWLALATVLACAAVGIPGAHANGRNPASNGVYFNPLNPQQITVQATFGLVITNDGGAHWNWVCEQSIGYMANYDPGVAYTANATSPALLVTIVSGVARTTDGGCSFTAATGFPVADQQTLVSVNGVAAHSSDETVVLATAAIITGTATDGVPGGGVFRSTDGGQSFALVTSSQITGLAGAQVRFSVANPDRAVAVLSDGLSQSQAIVSDDKGLSWRQLAPFPGNATLLGLSTSKANLAFFAGESSLYSLDLDDPMAKPKAVLTASTLRGFAETPAGFFVTTIAALYQSTDEGATWTGLSYHPRQASCLEGYAGQAYLCASNYLNKFALGRFDGSQEVAANTIETLYTFADIGGPVQCAGGTPTELMCIFSVLAAQLASMPGGTTPVDGGVPTDASVATDAGAPPPKKSGGCSLPAGAPTSETGVGVVLAGLALSAARARRRRR